MTPILVTFVVSAIWHGFYPGLFMFFIGAGICEVIAKLAQNTILADAFSPFVAHKLSYIWLVWHQTGLGLCFILYSFEKINLVYKSLNYIPVILLFL